MLEPSAAHNVAMLHLGNGHKGSPDGMRVNDILGGCTVRKMPLPYFSPQRKPTPGPPFLATPPTVVVVATRAPPPRAKNLHTMKLCKFKHRAKRGYTWTLKPYRDAAR